MHFLYRQKNSLCLPYLQLYRTELNMAERQNNNSKPPRRKSGCKLSIEERMRYERWIVSTIRNKLNALSNAQLKSAAETASDKKPSRTSQKSIRALTDELVLLLKSVGQKPKIRHPESPQASREEKLMVRFDGDGWLFPIKTADELSDTYKNALSQHSFDYYTYHSPDYQPPRRPNPKQYDLRQIPVWQNSMQKFINYRKTAPIIRRRLADINFPADRLSDLNFYDLMYIITEEIKSTRKLPFEPRGYANTRMFADCYGDQFRRIMGVLDYKPDYIENSLNIMRKGGLPDIFNRHHKTNVQDCKEFGDISKTNGFPNFLIVKIDPIHNGLHRPLSFEIDNSIVFMAGYDPILQIRRDPEIERQYIRRQAKLAREQKQAQLAAVKGAHAKTNR